MATKLDVTNVPPCNSIILVGSYYTNFPHAAEIGIYNAMVDLGIQCTILDPKQQELLGNHDWPHLLKNMVGGLNPDFILVPGPLPYGERIRSAVDKTPVVGWNAEEVRLFEYADKLRRGAPFYDFVFHFDESALSIYDGHVKTAWLPLAHDPCRHVERPLIESMKNYVVFVGNVTGKHSNRMVLCRHLMKAGVPVKVIRCMNPMDIASIYSSAIAVLNLGLDTKEFPQESFRAYSLQQRIFEAMGSGAAVLTNTPEGYPEFNNHRWLVPDDHCVFFNATNVVEKSLRLMRDKEFRLKVKEGARQARKHHTYAARIKTMVNKLREENII